MKIGNRKYEPHYDARHGFYFTHLQVGGKRKYYGLGTNLRDAQKRLKELLRKKASGELNVNTEATTRALRNGKQDLAFRELAHRHLEACVEPEVSHSTYALRRFFVNQFLSYLERVHPNLFWASEVTDGVLNKYYKTKKLELLQRKKTKDCQQTQGGTSGLMPHAANGHLRHLRTLFRWGSKEGLCQMPDFPEMTKGKGKGRRIDDNPLHQLMSYPRLPDDLRDMILLALITGLRPVETYSLRRSWLVGLNSASPRIKIEHHKTAKRGKVYSPREVHLTALSLEIIHRQINKHPDSDYIFLNGSGEPYTDDSYRKRFQRWCERAGIGHAYPYQLRHCFATAASLTSGLQVIKAAMGHTKVETTLGYISEVDESQKTAMRSTTDYFANLLKDETQKPDKTDRVDDREP